LDLIKRYQKKSSAELVRIIETAEDYQPSAIEVAKDVLRSRNLEQAEVLRLAREVQSEKIEAYLENFSVLNDKLELPESHFLNEEEMKLVFKTCFTRWKTENDDMIPDSWLYVLGAGFG
jgi:hypothetical protein